MTLSDSLFGPAAEEIQLLSELDPKPGYDRHHLIEERLAARLEVDPDTIPSVYLTPEEHQPFTQAWRTEIGYSNSKNPVTTNTFTFDDVVSAVNKVYANQPAYLQAS